MIQVSFVGHDISDGSVLYLSDLAKWPHSIVEALTVGDTINYQHSICPLYLVDRETIFIVDWNIDNFNIKQAALQRDSLFVQQVCVWSIFANEPSCQIADSQCCNQINNFYQLNFNEILN